MGEITTSAGVRPLEAARPVSAVVSRRSRPPGRRKVWTRAASNVPSAPRITGASSTNVHDTVSGVSARVRPGGRFRNTTGVRSVATGAKSERSCTLSGYTKLGEDARKERSSGGGRMALAAPGPSEPRRSTGGGASRTTPPCGSARSDCS